MGRILKVVSPGKYVWCVHSIAKNLLEGAAKNLLGMVSKGNTEYFTNILSIFAVLCPDDLFIEPCPARGFEYAH